MMKTPIKLKGMLPALTSKAAEDPAQNEGHSGPPKDHVRFRQVIGLGQVARQEDYGLTFCQRDHSFFSTSSR